MEDFDVSQVTSVERPEPATPVERKKPARRRLDIYKRTLSIIRMPKRDLEAGRLEFPVDPLVEESRPKTYGQCEREGLGEPGNPCPWALCAYNLLLDVSEATGSIRFNFPGRDFDELPETCALHVANHVMERSTFEGALSLKEVGEIYNVTHERIRQIEEKTVMKIQRELHAMGIATGADEDAVEEAWRARKNK